MVSEYVAGGARWGRPVSSLRACEGAHNYRCSCRASVTILTFTTCQRAWPWPENDRIRVSPGGQKGRLREGDERSHLWAERSSQPPTQRQSCGSRATAHAAAVPEKNGGRSEAGWFRPSSSRQTAGWESGRQWLSQEAVMRRRGCVFARGRKLEALCAGQQSSYGLIRTSRFDLVAGWLVECGGRRVDAVQCPPPRKLNVARSRPCSRCRGLPP